MHTPSPSAPNATALPSYRMSMEGERGPDHSRNAAVRTPNDGSQGQCQPLLFAPGLQQQSIATTNIHNLGAVNNLLDEAFFQVPEATINSDRLSYDPSVFFSQSDPAGITNNFGTVNIPGALHQDFGIAAGDDQLLNGFNGPHQHYQGPLELYSPTANSSYQTDYHMDPQAVELQRGFLSEQNSMNYSSQLSIAEDRFSINPAFYAAFNPPLDSGYYIPAVTAGARCSMNVNPGASSSLAKGSDPPAPPLGVDGESSNGGLRTRRYQTIKPRMDGPVRCEWRDCTGTASFKRREDLLRHVKTKHIMPTKYICGAPGCTKVSDREDKMAEHVRKSHR